MDLIELDEFIERTQEIAKKGKKAYYWMLSFTAISVLSLTGAILGLYKDLSIPEVVYCVIFWYALARYCKYCHQLAVDTLKGQEQATKKLLYLLKLERSLFAWIIFIFIAIKINKAFKDVKNRELLALVLLQLRSNTNPDR